ncbi:MAG TPA: acyltransferase [Candidatus Sulfopaludibacter sp.]|nr:acyltransferase [Candidatus Sulfopaludibacter sp.]
MLDKAIETERSSRVAGLTRSYLLADLSVGRTNNFNLLRFFAASLVIVSHCSALAWGQNPEPILRYFGSLETGGSLGVLIFFVISGFLVVQSFVARSRLKYFVAARALRIYPGLVAAVIYSTVIGALATEWPLRDFLRDHQTRRFLLYNSLAYPIQFNLPGVFEHNPLKGGVNGSLWTLPLEIQMYIVVAVIGLMGLFKGREIYNAFFAGFLILAASVKGEALPLIAQHPEAPRLAIAFLCGAFFFMNRDRIRISIPWALLLAAFIVWGHTRIPNIRMIYIPAVAYIVLVLGYHPKLYFAPYNRLGDYSYGLYIYAFPTQQFLSYRYPGIHQFPLFAMAFPCILVLAVLSWHFIEKPALRRKPG